jgi:hypothetical protein
MVFQDAEGVRDGLLMVARVEGDTDTEGDAEAERAFEGETVAELEEVDVAETDGEPEYVPSHESALTTISPHILDD